MLRHMWKRIIASDVDYEHLIAELYVDEVFIFQLDRENGRDNIHISIHDSTGKLSKRIPLNDFFAQINESVHDLKK